MSSSRGTPSTCSGRCRRVPSTAASLSIRGPQLIEWNGALRWLRTDQSQTSAVLGDGGLYSSIDDLAKWDAALYDERLLKKSSLHAAFTAATRTDDPAVEYGYGWRISGETLWHSGETIGFRNVIVRYPQRRLTVVMLTNRNDPEPHRLALKIAALYR